MLRDSEDQSLSKYQHSAFLFHVLLLGNVSIGMWVYSSASYALYGHSIWLFNSAGQPFYHLTSISSILT